MTVENSRAALEAVPDFMQTLIPLIMSKEISESSGVLKHLEKYQSEHPEAKDIDLVHLYYFAEYQELRKYLASNPPDSFAIIQAKSWIRELISG